MDEAFDESQWRTHYYHRDILPEAGGWPDWVMRPYPPVELGSCPICGHATQRFYTSMTPFDTRTVYVCPWCRATSDVFHTGPPGHTFVPTYPYYAPPPDRWEEKLGGSPHRSHAMDLWGLTLCGLETDGFTDYGVMWAFDAVDACPACRTAAIEIDARWPVDRRAGSDIFVRCPCPVCRAADPRRKP